MAGSEQLTLVGLLGDDLLSGGLDREIRLQDGLRPVEADLNVLSLFCSCLFQFLAQTEQNIPGQIAAPPVEEEAPVLPDGLSGSPYNLFLLGKGELLFPIVEAAAVTAGRDREENRFVVPENGPVIQTKVIIADRSFAGKSVVKGSVQMVILAVEPDDIPCMAILNPLFRVVAADRNDAPDP